MLFLVAALLTPSGVASGVAEAFSVHEIGQPLASISTADTRTAADSTAILRDPRINGSVAPASVDSTVAGVGDRTASTFPWTIPTSLDGSGSGNHGLIVSNSAIAEQRIAGTKVDIALLPRLSGVPLLDQLALLPRADLSRFIADNPRTVKQLMTDPPAARDVSAWWASTPSHAKKSMISAAPQMVGNLSGLPFDVRNTANRDYLNEAIREVKTSITQLGRGEVVEARLHLRMLEKVRDALKSSASEPSKSLLTFNASGSGRAAIAVGDPSTADYVSYLVPGMFFSVDTALNTWTTIASDLNTEQQKWVSRLASSDLTMANKTVATVAWIGYDTPGITGVASTALADQGAKLIGRAIEGVHTVRVGAEPFVTIIGHSYGSTAAMIELAKGSIHVDALALIGSPGSAAQSVSDLSVPQGNVFVGEAAWDPVVNSAFYGSDPGSGAFGATRMSVAGGVDPITHRALTASAGHLGYFEPGSESMRNLALIGLNHGSLVTEGTAMDASRTLR